MSNRHPQSNDTRNVTREELVALLNEDLAGEYQAIISYVIYSQVLKGTIHEHCRRVANACR